MCSESLRTGWVSVVNSGKAAGDTLIYAPMMERLSGEYDESDNNMVLELAVTDHKNADLKQQMGELKHQHPFGEKLLEE